MSSQTEFMSFYVPFVPDGFTEEVIRQLFILKQIGLVERVDFFQGANELIINTWNSAFIHLRYWEFNMYTDNIYNTLESGGQWRLNIPGLSKFIILKKMNCQKIPDTCMNIHQMAAKMEEMSEEIVNLSHEIFKLKAKLDEHEDAIAITREQVVNMENTEFVEQYDEKGAMTLDELESQTYNFMDSSRFHNYFRHKKEEPCDGGPMTLDELTCNFQEIKLQDKRRCSSSSSSGSCSNSSCSDSSAAKRIRISDELCGNK